MRDIQDRQDIDVLLKAFYSKLLQDHAISYIFTDVAKIDLKAHLPHLGDFWEQTLFHTGGYRKNVLQLHLDLNNKEPLTHEHFSKWLYHFYTVTDQLFEGPNSELIKTRAESIATVIKIKILTTKVTKFTI